MQLDEKYVTSIIKNLSKSFLLCCKTPNHIRMIQTQWGRRAKEGDTWQGIRLKSKRIERIGM